MGDSTRLTFERVEGEEDDRPVGLEARFMSGAREVVMGFVGEVQRRIEAMERGEFAVPVETPKQHTLMFGRWFIDARNAVQAGDVEKARSAVAILTKAASKLPQE